MDIYDQACLAARYHYDCAAQRAAIVKKALRAKKSLMGVDCCYANAEAIFIFEDYLRYCVKE